jgi:Flp pilus assembly pilin Flp
MAFRSQRKIWAEDGQGLVEYALIILLMSVAIVIALGVFGVGLNTRYTSIIGSF